MYTVISADRTRTAYYRYGEGPAVILVTGAMVYRKFKKFEQIAEVLSDHCTVINYDRRGRGDSGEAGPVSVQHEVEDIAALIDAAGGRASLCGAGPREARSRYGLPRRTSAWRSSLCTRRRLRPTPTPSIRSRTTASGSNRSSPKGTHAGSQPLHAQRHRAARSHAIVTVLAQFVAGGPGAAWRNASPGGGDRGFVDWRTMSAREVDEYLRGVEEPKRSTLEQLRRTILEIVPDAEQVISYRVPAFRVGGKTIAGFAAFKAHLSYLPFSGSVLEALSEELRGYTMTKSALHFPADRPLPKSLVEKLIGVRLEQLRR